VSVEFHCGNCGRLVRAPRESAGQRGKCPYCKQSIYIPSPPDELEEIPLAPVDEEDLRRRDALDREAERMLADVDRAGDLPEGDAGPASEPRRRGSDDVDLEGLVISAVQALRKSDLDRADRLLGRLREHRDRSLDYVQAMMLDEIPPSELEDCPPALYKGFLRTILQRL
jgi:DNA-directed RNA polymerase subunit RPC12/RpoP